MLAFAPPSAVVSTVDVVSTMHVVSTVDDVQYFWSWTDGSRADGRTFTDPGTGPVDLPGLVVASSPAARGRLVVLQFRDGRGWHTEDVARTNARGVAVVGLNPYCDDGAWCDGTLVYRLLVDGQDAPLRVTFAE